MRRRLAFRWAALAVLLLWLLAPHSGLGQRVVEQWVLKPEDSAPELRFGRSVDVSGDLVVVGATGDTTNGPRSGAVYVFENTDGHWAPAKLVPPDGEAEARFGWNVGVVGGRIAVSAPWASNPVRGRSGKLYLYEKVDGTWTHQLLRIRDPAISGQVGRGMAVAGNRIVVGAPYDDNAAGDRAGAIAIFETTSQRWSSETHISKQGVPDGWFGFTIAGDGDRFGVGGYHAEQASGPEAGSASVFERAADGTWTERPLAPVVDPERRDHFGRALAFVGPRVFVGAEEDDNANGTNAGGVFALHLERPEAPPQLILPSDGAPRSYFGYVMGATDRYLAVRQGADVYLFSAFDQESPQERTLSALTGASLPGTVSAMAGDGQRLVIGTAFAATPEPNAGAVVVVDLAP
jgi:hypothetical protein